MQTRYLPPAPFVRCCQGCRGVQGCVTVTHSCPWGRECGIKTGEFSQPLVTFWGSSRHCCMWGVFITPHVPLLALKPLQKQGEENLHCVCCRLCDNSYSSDFCTGTWGCLAVLICEWVLIAGLALPHTRSSCCHFSLFLFPLSFGRFVLLNGLEWCFQAYILQEIIDTRSECCSQEIQHTWELCAAQPYGKSTSAHSGCTGFCHGVLHITFSECSLKLFLAQMDFL